MSIPKSPNPGTPDPICYYDAYNLILECCACQSPKAFAATFLEQLGKICYFDEAMVFFLDESGKLYDQYLINLDEALVTEYLDYLNSGDCPREFQLYQMDKNESSLGCDHLRLIRWDEAAPTEFITGYVQPRGLKYTWGFCFFDMHGTYRMVFALNRTRDVPFSELEQSRLKLLLPVLNNMHRHFFYLGQLPSQPGGETRWEDFHLTKREIEVAELLCQGMTIQNISKTLFIAKATTYKHVNHIYEKVGVSSHQELLLKKMGFNHM